MDNLNIFISDILKSLGISPNKIGYHYLRSAIVACYNQKELMVNVSKELYPIIAKMYKSSWKNVERTIRSSIETGCIRADYDFQIKVFKSIIDVNKGKPTNSEFIAAVADYVNLRFVVNNNC